MRRFLLSALGAAALVAPQNAAQASGGGGGGAEGLNLVAMPEVTVPIIEAGRIQGALRIELAIEGVDAAATAEIGHMLPEMRSRAIGAALEFGRLYVSGLRAVDAERLSEQLTHALHEAQPGVQRVLIVEVAAAPE